MEILLLRHTRVDFPKNVLYGQLDVPLLGTWQVEFDEIAKKCGDLKGVPVYTSPLSRCKKLADYLNESSEMHTEDRIMELSYGEWEGKHLRDLPQDKLIHWKSNFVDNACPGGETFKQLRDRGLAFIEDILNKPTGKALVVTHSGVIRALLVHWQNIPLHDAFTFNIDFGSLSVVHRVSNKIIVKSINL
ncbi:MAG: alpha-ribazole phosphatase family protein [Cyclobacteriaceae bacterium]